MLLYLICKHVRHIDSLRIKFQRNSKIPLLLQRFLTGTCVFMKCCVCRMHLVYMWDEHTLTRVSRHAHQPVLASPKSVKEDLKTSTYFPRGGIQPKLFGFSFLCLFFMAYFKNNFCFYDAKGNSFQIIMCMWWGEWGEWKDQETLCAYTLMGGVHLE